MINTDIIHPKLPTPSPLVTEVNIECFRITDNMIPHIIPDTKIRQVDDDQSANNIMNNIASPSTVPSNSLIAPMNDPITAKNDTASARPRK